MATAHTILVLGATGGSGLAFIREVLDHTSTHKLTLYVRNASKLPADITSNPRVHTVTGQLSDANALQAALKGVDTVASFLGAYVSLSAFIWRTKTTPIADCFPALFEAMRANGATRILALSTPSVRHPDDRFTWGWAAYAQMPPLLVPQGNAEMVGIGEAVRQQDDLDWTVFRVPHLNDGSRDEKVAAGVINASFQGSGELSRASLARWVLAEIDERKWVKSLPMLGNY